MPAEHSYAGADCRSRDLNDPNDLKVFKVFKVLNVFKVIWDCSRLSDSAKNAIFAAR